MTPPAESLSSVSTPPVPYSTESGEEGVKWHFNTVLQTLNAYFPSKHTESKKLLYSVENFKDSLQNWDNTLIIYTPDGTHLNWEDYKSDPVKELNRVNGRIVGSNFNARIPDDGARRLECDQIFWDNECNALISEGKLGISTDFNCPIEEDRLSGTISPNYVLAFPAEYANEQNDIGARIMNSVKSAIDANSSEEIKMDTELKAAFDKQENLLTTFIESVKTIFPHRHTNSAESVADSTRGGIVDKMEANTLTVAPTVPVEFLEKLNAVEQEMEDAKAKAEEMATKIAEFEQADAARAEEVKQAEMQRLEALWQTTIVPKIPKGLIHENEKADEIKKMFLETPYDFMAKYGEVLNKVDIETTVQHANSTTGQTHQNIAEPADKPEIVVPGSFDALKGAFV